jgi:putative intracellular protease/amidase/YHS domain-containing protein
MDQVLDSGGSMKTTMITLIAALLALLPCVLMASNDRIVALRGLDPTRLVAGKEEMGKPEFVSEYGRFRYQFSSEDNRKVFDAEPERYAIQSNGRSAVVTYLPGDPAKFFVFESKIYLADSNEALAELKKNPAPYVKDLQASRKVAIMVFPGVQIIDYTGPYEVFGQAGYDVFTVAANGDPIVTNMFMTIIPNYTFDKCPKPDLIVLPGGTVPRVKQSDPKIQWILSNAKKGEEVMSVCNGAFWLANAGLLDGKKATTYYGLLDKLKKEYPKVNVVSDCRFADNGQIICTAGLSSGIDGALHMVERQEGKGTAQAIALNMEYNWQPDGGFVRGAYADMYLRRQIGRQLDFGDSAQVKVLQVAGNKDKWDQAWEVTGPNLSAKSLREGLAKKLSAGWKSVKADSGDEDSLWEFTGEDGKPWLAVTAVRLEQTGKFVVKVSLQRK